VHRVNGHEIRFEPGKGWRCGCPLWEENGWGCVHTVQVSAMEAMEREATDVHRGARDGDGLVALQGKARGVVAARGIIDFEVAGCLVSLITSRTANDLMLREGEPVAVVAREQAFQGYAEVLAIRRAGMREARYTGRYPGRNLAAAVSVLGLAELSSHVWVAVAACGIVLPLALLYGACWLQRRRVMRRFAAAFAR
jgi:hypothetical protein